MELQEKQVALDLAYREMRQRAYDSFIGPVLGMHGGVITSLTRCTNAVKEPDCSYNRGKLFDLEEGGYMWEPKDCFKVYFTTLPCEAAVDLCESINSEGADILLMPPSHGGWGTTMHPWLKQTDRPIALPGIVF